MAAPRKADPRPRSSHPRERGLIPSPRSDGLLVRQRGQRNLPETLDQIGRHADEVPCDVAQIVPLTTFDPDDWRLADAANRERLGERAVEAEVSRQLIHWVDFGIRCDSAIDDYGVGIHAVLLRFGGCLAPDWRVAGKVLEGA
jgi:hypothetical protein